MQLLMEWVDGCGEDRQNQNGNFNLTKDKCVQEAKGKNHHQRPRQRFVDLTSHHQQKWRKKMCQQAKVRSKQEWTASSNLQEIFKQGSTKRIKSYGEVFRSAKGDQDQGQHGRSTKGILFHINR